MITNVERITLPPTYIKENGTWVLNLKDIVFPSYFIPKEQSLISIAPLQFGGNHKHPRMEAFIATSPMKLVWIDDENRQREEQMYTAGQITIYLMPPYIPHAVINTSAQSVLLYEFANEPQHDVQIVSLTS